MIPALVTAYSDHQLPLPALKISSVTFWMTRGGEGGGAAGGGAPTGRLGWAEADVAAAARARARTQAFSMRDNGAPPLGRQRGHSSPDPPALSMAGGLRPCR